MQRIVSERLGVREAARTPSLSAGRGMRLTSGRGRYSLDQDHPLPTQYFWTLRAGESARQLKCMTVVDEFTRQGFEITVGRSLTASDVIRILDRLFCEHGRPACIRSDNGPEMVSTAVQKWLKEKHVDTHYIDPGSPWQNGYCESFNSIFRITCLDRWLFCSMTEARVVINQWLEEYNTIRPHGSLGGMNPELFLQRWTEGKMNQQPKTLTA